MNKDSNLNSIDGLRFFLVSSVIFHHFFILKAIDPNTVDFLRTMQKVSHLAVQYFFVLSGFLIFKKMQTISIESKKPILSFYSNRFFKIIPLWWFVLIIYFIFEKLNVSEFLLYASFCFGFVGYKLFVIPHAWSLFVEEVFYVFFPWLNKILNSIGNTIILFLCFWLISHLWLNNAERFGVPNQNFFISFSPAAHFHFFFLGILIYHFRSGSFFVKISHYLRNKLFEILILGVSIVLLIKFEAKYLELVIFLTFSIILNEKCLLSKFASNRYFAIAGKAVYPTYLVHFIITSAFVNTVQNEPIKSYLANFGRYSFYFELLYLIFFINVFGIILHKIIERPFVRIGLNIQNRLSNKTNL